MVYLKDGSPAALVLMFHQRQRLMVDCRALSSGAPTLPCGIYQLALYQLEILLYRGHHSENNLRIGLGMFLWFGDLRARNLFYANPDTLQGDQRRWGI